ncbi:MAG TPA: IS66 family transposase [Candidatus Moranbacteria bacterium]|nr:IS66 family transposase [Candidatus Moranbacteria bacterium]
MTYQERFLSLRLETRKLRQDCATYFRAWESQKEKSERLARENGELKKENKDLKERLGDTLEQLDREIEIKEKYRGMLFKSSKKENPVPKAGAEKKKRGGQIGHIGTSREKPTEIDQEKEVFLCACPHCQGKLTKSNSFYGCGVEDIELYKKTIVTKYNIQRQWCPDCKKEVRGIPQGTIENSPFGINILLWIMIQKYRLRLPLESISASLEIQYGLKIREGTIQKILHTLKKKFGSKYAELINEVRKNKIKYADETGWRIQGQNAWCWMFSSPDSVVYTIEETRGKGVPQRMLGNSPPGVLIRDDYAAYKKLDLPQQSCWSHLLRNSREKAERENSSKEVRDLHATLKAIFSELSEIIPQKMFAKKRKEVHQIYKKKIQVIIDTKYIAKDVQEIQTRITNQNTNLITAILYPGVPLTNNEAERNIRKMVVTRKISGGSRSDNGAATHAVNMSIIQTLALKKETLVSELQKLLNPAMVGLVLEKGE